MILVTRLDNSQFYVNAEFIQSVESRPDTNITLINGHSYFTAFRTIEEMLRQAGQFTGA